MKKIILSALLCAGIVFPGSPMELRVKLDESQEVLECGEEIETLLEEKKANYKEGVYKKPVVERKNNGALLKAVCSKKLLVIAVFVAGCFILLPILDAMIPMRENCISQTSPYAQLFNKMPGAYNKSGVDTFVPNIIIPSNETALSLITNLGNGSDLPNSTNTFNETVHGVGEICVMAKDEFLSSIMQQVRGYLPFIIVIQVVGTIGMIYSEVNAISPIPAKTLAGDVIGIDDHVMDKIRVYIKVFQEPKIFNDLGAELPKGLLLVGPEGTGKTLIARAIAGETKKAFFNFPATSFVKPTDLQTTFATARKYKPSVLFIDEIDSIGAVNRGLQSSDATSMSKIALLNALLVELGNDNSEVMIIGATNYPKLLDRALTRSGRFDNVIEIPKPGFMGRVKLLLHYLFKLPKLDFTNIDSKFVENLGETTEGFTASDFENIAKQAALAAGNKRKLKVDATDVEAGLEAILGNKKAIAQTY